MCRVVDADPMDPTLRRGRTSSNPDKYPTLTGSREAPAPPAAGADDAARRQGRRRRLHLRQLPLRPPARRPYAVGAPNHGYAYGRQILALMLVPALGLGRVASGHDPAAVAVVQPLLDRIAGDATLGATLIATLLGLAGAGGAPTTLSVDDEHHYAAWLPGTLDFLIAPLPIDDQVHTVGKISALWSIATPAEDADAQLG
jgi:hypothetical protein